MLWIILVILVILVFFSYVKYEMFSDIVGYNTSEVIDDSLNTPFAMQNNNIQKLLDDANKSNPKLSDADTVEGTLYNSNINFPLEDAFKNVIRDYLVKNKILTNNLFFPTGISKMYIRETGSGSKVYSFNITVNEKDTFISRTLMARVTVNNLSGQIDINSMDLLAPKNNNFLLTESIDELNPNYYEIYNKYHLMDPFLTSGRKMIITDLMKSAFDKIVEQKKNQKDTMK
jgi:hypothetical protein